jgi:nucleotide-binding universal stress UspA family protein
MRARELIVVGVDGSDAAAAAVRWACVQAISIGAVIEAIHASPHSGLITSSR